MMTNDSDWLLLNALVDQELDAAASLSLEERIADEPLLAAAHARIVATKQAVERLEKPEVSDGFYDRMAALASPTVVPPAQAIANSKTKAWGGLARDSSLTGVYRMSR